MYETGIIRHHIIELLGLLQRPNDPAISALQDLDYLARSFSFGAKARYLFVGDSRHHPIPMERSAGLARWNVNVPLPIAGCIEHVTESLRVDQDNPRNQVRGLRKDITILPDPSDLPT